MFWLKKILDNVIDVAYKDSVKLHWYKKYYIEIEDEVKKSFHGAYNPENKKIRICNLYRDNTLIICTTLHEVAHHIDCTNRGKTSHDEHFYEEYKKLLFSALDIDLFSVDDFLKTINDISGRSKIEKILKSYTPKEKTKQTIIKINNGFEYKEFLKDKGYIWNSLNKCWNKIVVNLEEETSILNEKGVKYEILNGVEFESNTGIYVIAINSYKIKDYLLKNNFKYAKYKKAWFKEFTTINEARRAIETIQKENEYIFRYNNIRFEIVNSKPK